MDLHILHKNRRYEEKFVPRLEKDTIIHLLLGHGNSWWQQWMHLKIAVLSYLNSEGLHLIGVHKILMRSYICSS
jgi:hypothetical protein